MRFKAISILFVLALIAMILLGCSGSPSQEGESDADNTMAYVKADQIQLYTEQNDGYDILAFAEEGYTSVTVDDTTVLKITDGRLIPLSAGIATLRCSYEKKLVSYDVIVHYGNDPQNKLYDVEGKTLTLVLGQAYSVPTDAINAPRFEFKSKNSDISADEIVRADKRGYITAVGIGEVIVDYYPNSLSDIKLSFEIKTEIPSDEIGNTVLTALGKSEIKEGEYVKYSDLEKIHALSFNGVRAVNEMKLKAVLPGLNMISMNLTDTDEGRIYIGQGNFSYKVVGSKDKVYNLGVSSGTRSRIDISFTDFSSSYEGSVLFDFSQVGASHVEFNGACKLKSGAGYSVIDAKNLKIDIFANSQVELLGSDGLGGAVDGSSAINALGSVEIAAPSTASNVSLTVKGGNGIDGSANGGRGGNGGYGVKSLGFILMGKMTAVISGGNGGNGQNGYHGSDGQSHGDGSWWSASDGGDGANGVNGGNGGKGAYGIYATEVTISGASVTLSGGNSGNAGNGGNGGDGGKGANADAIGATAGDGGDGGNAGNGGSAYVGAAPTNLEKIIVTAGGTCDLSTGTDGQIGLQGTNGLGGKGGSSNGWWGANKGSNGKDGKVGFDGSLISE